MACGIETGVVAADAALSAGRTTVDDLRTWLARLSRHPDVTRAREAVRLADPRSESVGESRARLLLHAFNQLPAADANSRAALAAEKSREDLLRALGYELVRLTWADPGRPATVERLMRQAQARTSARRAS